MATWWKLTEARIPCRHDPVTRRTRSTSSSVDPDPFRQFATLVRRRAGRDRRPGRGDDDRDRDAGRPAVGPGRAAARLRRARPRLLHELRQPQGRGAGREPARRRALLLAASSTARSGSRARSRASRRRSPTRTSAAGRAATRSARGRRRRARPIADRAFLAVALRRGRGALRRPDGRGAAARRSGAATGSSPRCSSSG